MAILDTSALIDLGRGVKTVSYLLQDLQANGSELKISMVTVTELAAGKTPGLSEAENRLLEEFEIVEFTKEIAENAGILIRDLKNKGLEIDMADCIIAATALKLKEEVVTGNEKHFKRIAKLKLVSYKR